MNNTQLKNSICLIGKKLNNKNRKKFFDIIDFLYEKASKKLSFYNGFECSFVGGDRDSMRLLHLSFWQSNLPSQVIKKILKKRELVIISIFEKLNKKFNCCYDFNICDSFFKFNKKNGPWPIQFGLEYSGKLKPKIKVYLSINGDKFPLKEFCKEFHLNYQILGKKFKNKKFDTIAIDFLPDGDYGFKFYPITGLNKGKLYRIDKNSKIISINKNWTRFPDGLLIDDKRVSNFIKLPNFLYEIIKENNFKIHYLCEENGKKSIYFR